MVVGKTIFAVRTVALQSLVANFYFYTEPYVYKDLKNVSGSATKSNTDGWANGIGTERWMVIVFITRCPSCFINTA